MDNYHGSYINNSINVNNEVNSDCCIRKVSEVIRNKKDARWFCQENRKFK